MDNHRLFTVLLFIAVGILLVSFFWKNTVVLSLVLIAAAYIKHRIMTIKKELLWFLIAGVVGAFGESMIMASGPWSYTNPDIINFPIWLVFLWGYAGTVGISLYQVIANIKS